MWSIISKSGQHITHIITDSSKTPRRDRDLQELDDDSYAVEFTPQCKMHQISMKMAVSPLPHSYWITTFSIPEASMLHNRNATLAGIAKRVCLEPLHVGAQI